MTTELFYLTLTSLLLATMWVPYIVGVNMYPVDAAADFRRPPDLKQFPQWVHRAHRAHLNLLEQCAPYCALLITAHLLEVSNVYTVWAAASFFWLRIAHALGMISGFARFPIRPMIFTAGWLCIMVIGWQILASS